MQPGTNSVVCYSNSSTPLLLQTAQAIVYNPQRPECKVKVRIILESGSQRTYLTDNLKKILQLPVLERKQVSIKTFGSTDERVKFVEIASLGIELKGGPTLSLSVSTVPLICQPLQGQSTKPQQGELNATIKHHIGQYEQCDPSFIQKFLESIYFDDFTSGKSDVIAPLSFM